MQLPIEDLCSLSSRSLQSPFAATVPASTEDILHKGFQMLTMENDRIETAQQVDLLASLNSFVPKQTCRASIRCSVDGLLLCVAVFFLVCQTTNKDGPGWKCKIQVRKGWNALWHADFSVTSCIQSLKEESLGISNHKYPPSFFVSFTHCCCLHTLATGVCARQRFYTKLDHSFSLFTQLLHLISQTDEASCVRAAEKCCMQEDLRSLYLYYCCQII